MEAKVEQVFLPLRQNRKEVEEEFAGIYKKLICVLKSDRQKKKSHRTARANSYYVKEIHQMSQRVIATAELLETVASQERELAQSLSAQLAKQVHQCKKQHQQLQACNATLVHDLERLESTRSTIESQMTQVDEKYRDIQTQVGVSQQNETTFANLLVESHRDLNALQGQVQAYRQQIDARKRAEDECSMYQTRLQQLHRAHESYVKEKRQYMHENEQHLLKTRREIDQIRHDMQYQNQMIHSVNVSIDQLIQQAAYLDTPPPQQQQQLPAAAYPQPAPAPAPKTQSEASRQRVVGRRRQQPPVRRRVAPLEHKAKWM